MLDQIPNQMADQEKNNISVTPGISLFVFSIAALISGTVSFFFQPLLYYWKLASASVLFFAAFDFIRLLFFTDRLNVKRVMSESLSLGTATEVKLTVFSCTQSCSFAKRIPRKFKIFDLFDDSMLCESMPISFIVKNKCDVRLGNWDFSYTVKPIMRGNWEFSGTHILISSFLHFWRIKIVHKHKTQGKTYPNFSILTKQQSLNAILHQSGEKNIQKRGQGMEFDALREWQNGDSMRFVDWRATSRRGKVIVRQYQEEQDQHILLLLDSGYRMHRQDSEIDSLVQGSAYLPLTQFDFALNAALLLAWSALKRGDSVAASVFGGTEKWQPPRKGASSFGTLMNMLYDVQSSGAPSSPFAVLQNVIERLKRRTFIVMISNFRAEDKEQISWILPQITKRHLLLMVSLCETDAQKIATRSFAEGYLGNSRIDEDNILETVAACAYIKERAALYKQWEHSGLLTLETSALNLSAALINRYLSVKRSGLL